MKDIELLSPVGSKESLIAAVQSGANAIYFGAKLFNARASAANFDDEELKKTIEYAKMRNVKTNLTLNTLIKNDELIDALDVVNTAYSFGIDAIIVQDIGLATLIHKFFPDLPLHGSTQMAVHNLAGVKELEKLGFTRVVLARELSFDQIEYICKNTNMEIECFIHGALCVSYSGQCLLSSMIGQRSGNRGKCSAPCRLPYSLLKDGKVLKNGYLISPKDLCTIDYLEKYKEIGVTSLKIEGRLKQPEYVSLVTKTYRDALDGKKTTEEDIKNLKQMFNRGEFTTAFLNEKQDITFPIKPKNLGIKLGEILDIDKKKDLIKVKLTENVSMGDGIETINNEISTVISEILLNNQHVKKANKGDIVYLGRVKGSIPKNLELYKTSSKELNTSIIEYINRSYVKAEIPKIQIDIHENTNIKIKVNDEFEYVSDIIPDKSINFPITEDSVIKQFSKTGNIPFTFKEYVINLDNNLFMPVSVINKLRTDCLEKYYAFKVQNILREKVAKEKYVKYIQNEINKDVKNNTDKEIYITLNKLPKDIENIQSVDGIYLPYRLLTSENMETIDKLCSTNNVYIAIPNIVKDLENIEFKFPNNIKGLLISNISQLNMFNKDYTLHMEYTGNIFNNFTNNYYLNNNCKLICVSPEMNEYDINSIPSDNMQVLCYGRIKCMTMQNCIVKDCKNCPNYNYSLVDRMNLEFPIITDKTNCTMNLYNSKILAYAKDNFNAKAIRLDFIEETTQEINNILNLIKQNSIPTGDNYTNGNYKKEV